MQTERVCVCACGGGGSLKVFDLHVHLVMQAGTYVRFAHAEVGRKAAALFKM